MAPTFSKLAVVATPEITVISDLRCSYVGCYALFSSLEDLEKHALNIHSGNVIAVSCSIHKKKMELKHIQLYHVLDKDGEDALQNKFMSAYYNISEYIITTDNYR